MNNGIKSPCWNCKEREIPGCKTNCKALHEYDLQRIENSKRYNDNNTYTQGTYIQQMKTQRYLLRIGNI